MLTRATVVPLPVRMTFSHSLQSPCVESQVNSYLDYLAECKQSWPLLLQMLNVRWGERGRGDLKAECLAVLAVLVVFLLYLSPTACIIQRRGALSPNPEESCIHTYIHTYIHYIIYSIFEASIELKNKESR